MSASTIKLILASILFGSWVGLTFAKSYIPTLDISTLIPAIQAALAGLGVYHTMDTPTSSTTPNEEAPK